MTPERSTDEMLATARLHDAAPYLLDALKKAIAFHEEQFGYRADDWHEGDRESYLIVKEGRAAIAKATP